LAQFYGGDNERDFVNTVTKECLFDGAQSETL